MTLRDVHEEIAEHLDAIKKLFKQPKLTLVVRNPQLRDGDVIETDDDLDLVIETLHKMKDRPPTFEPYRPAAIRTNSVRSDVEPPDVT